LELYGKGWHPLPLPAHAKKQPPDGTTGYDGTDWTYEQISTYTWAGNIASRMPVDVLGLDVDAYKGGLDTLSLLLVELDLLPLTWISHSGRNDGSGIRYYRVPAGMAWIFNLAGIEIIQRVHRYSVFPPSTHPDHGGTYAWWDQNEQAPCEAPAVEDLPELPWSWVEYLSRPAGSHSKAATAEQVATFLSEHTQADQAGYLGNVQSHFTDRVQAGHARHDSMQHCLIWAMECVGAALFDGRTAVAALGDLWASVHPDDARRAELFSQHRVTEYDAMLRHAVGKVLIKPQAELDKLHDDIAGPTFNVPPPTAEPEGQQLGAFIDWQAFLQRDSTDRRWLVEDFWPYGRALALWADAKAGKSELALWCAGNLALGRHPWTGQQIEPIDVAYFDYEMGEDDLEERLSVFDFDPAKLQRLHYALYPAIDPLDTAAGGQAIERLATQVGAKAAVFDTFGRSVAGEEDKADTVRAFFRHTGARLKRLGIGYLRTDHAGKVRGKGQRGSSAKRDDVDVIWALKRTGTGVQLDCTGSSRLSWVGPLLRVERTDVLGAVTYSAPIRMGWTDAAISKAAQLDLAGVPLDAGRPAAIAMLRAAGLTPGRYQTLTDALKLRHERRQTAP
jgi:hypothetical protein